MSDPIYVVFVLWATNWTIVQWIFNLCFCIMAGVISGQPGGRWHQVDGHQNQAVHAGGKVNMIYMTFRKIHLSYLDELENNVIIVLVDQGMLNILLARSSIFHLFSSFQLIFKITRVCLNFVHPSFGEHLPDTGATHKNPNCCLTGASLWRQGRKHLVWLRARRTLGGKNPSCHFTFSVSLLQMSSLSLSNGLTPFDTRRKTPKLL